jgi:hypothetical protein
MTKHDEARLNRALGCNRTDRESLLDALVGLQSTDDPSLVPLYDELQAALEKLDRETPPPIAEYVFLRAGIPDESGQVFAASALRTLRDASPETYRYDEPTQTLYLKRDVNTVARELIGKGLAEFAVSGNIKQSRKEGDNTVIEDIDITSVDLRAIPRTSKY